MALIHLRVKDLCHQAQLQCRILRMMALMHGAVAILQNGSQVTYDAQHDMLILRRPTLGGIDTFTYQFEPENDRWRWN